MINRTRLASIGLLAAGASAGMLIAGQLPARAQVGATTKAAAPAPARTPLRATNIPSAPYIAPPFTTVTNYYVSTKGSDKNDGTTLKSAWRTISHAVTSIVAQGGTHGGVTVNVAPGVYTECVYSNKLSGSSDTPTGYFVFLSTKLHGATVQVPKGDATGCSFDFDNASYIVVDGFNLVGQVIPTSYGCAFACNVDGLPGHHLKVLNNIMHDNGGAGVGACHTDYLDVEGNVIYNNVNTSTYENSGISLWQAVASDQLPGFHNVFRDNVICDNEEFSNGHQYHSDGNGIIMDDFHNTQGGSMFGNYTPQSLVENNLVFNNGGAGIHLYLTDNVTVRNNTVYHDYLDPLIGGANGEINEVNGSNDVFVNNIAVTDSVARPNNGAFLAAGHFGTGTGNVWMNNLTFNGNPGQEALVVQGLVSTITAANGNILGKDPLYVSVAKHNFKLRSGSPAIGAGTTAYGVPTDDLTGKLRTGPLDIGAYAAGGN